MPPEQEGEEQEPDLKFCDHEGCDRGTWKDFSYCVWHAEVDEKSKEDISQFIDETLDVSDAYLRKARLADVDFRGAGLSKADLRHADLSDADLSKSNLSGADLLESNLSRANLSDTHLRGANFSSANLSYANLTGADLPHTVFPHADLPYANLPYANLYGANFSSAKLPGADLHGANLSYANLPDADLSDADLSDADLSDADLSDANLPDADLSDANLSDANLPYANLTAAELAEVDLSEANLFGAELIRANLYRVDLSGARLTHADFSHADLSRADLSRADFFGADLSGTDLANADLHNAILNTDFGKARFGYDWVTPKTKLGETLRPTPYTPQTYWELPKNDPNAYFFYFTSDEYREDDSKYRKLDETLLHYGAYSSTKEVITTEKNRIPEPLWDSILNELDIEDWPALAVCRTSLGFEDISLADKTFACPHDVEIATLEQGIISDNLLRDKDRIKDFLNELYSGAKEDNLKQTMEDEKISELLNIGGRKLEELIQINPSM